MTHWTAQIRRSFGSLAWWLSGLLGASDLAIRHEPGRPVRVRGRVPKSKVPGISTFFARDLDPGRAVTVRGTWSGGAWRLQFSGGLSPSERQRVRNYLTEHLR